MPKIVYEAKNFRAPTLALIEQANTIIAEYVAQGFSLTLRQLYYQMVARAIIPNKQSEYKRLGGIITDARLAGLIDWNTIVDRTRNLRHEPHWSSPREIVEAVVEQYRLDRWENQPYRVEVWIEKDALTGVISGICAGLDVPYFSCRGYTSASEMWKAGQRLKEYWYEGQIPLVLHLGDHDPSGMDMTRDIRERLKLFGGNGIFVQRIALTMEQIREYDPPPNPTKLTDSRAPGYVAEYGYDSWELDALEPQVMAALIEDEVLSVRDEEKWEEKTALEKDHEAVLRRVADGLSTEGGG